jgi:hypothetical protein
MISKDTAVAIAMAHREVEAGEKLLEDVRQAIERFAPKDIRDAFGRSVQGLQLGVPSGETGHRLFNVPYQLAIPIIEMHIAQQRALITTLSEQAVAEHAVPY